jgi:hypothetical protein
VLETDHPDHELMEVAIVVEVRSQENEVFTPTACTNDSRVYQTGMFQWGLDNVQWSGSPADDPADDYEEDDDSLGSGSD